MKKRLVSVFLCALMLVTLLPVKAHADVGPKESLTVTFLNLGDQECHATLLSSSPFPGRWLTWDGTEMGLLRQKAFTEYEDPDGYYLLLFSQRVDEDNTLQLIDFFPDSFKILLYFPETGNFISSGVYERYAFDSYFTVNMAGVDSNSPTASIKLRRSYDYGREILGLLARIILTIALELGVALLFGFREREVLWLITKVNILTQVILNVLLNVANFYAGLLAFILGYFFLEALVLLIESMVYTSRIPKLTTRKRAGFVAGMYALVANLVSFIVGLWLGVWFTAIF